jgi:hypothetical protein
MRYVMAVRRRLFNKSSIRKNLLVSQINQNELATHAHLVVARILLTRNTPQNCTESIAQ